MRKIQFLGLIYVFISLLACGQTKQNYADTRIENGWKELNDNIYTIQYPDSWDLNNSGQMGMSLILLSKLTSQQDHFRENINLIIQDLTGQNINLDKYVEISEKQIKTIVTNGNLLESSRLNKNGSDFQKVIYTGNQGLYKLKFEQYYWIRNEKAYVLTLTCEIDQFDNYKEIGEKILNSFKLK